jgi:hypothetical protein
MKYESHTWSNGCKSKRTDELTKDMETDMASLYRILCFMNMELAEDLL